MIKDRIESNQNTVVGVAIGVVVVMVSFCITWYLFSNFSLSVPEHAVLIRHVHHGQVGCRAEEDKKIKTKRNKTKVLLIYIDFNNLSMIFLIKTFLIQILFWLYILLD